jgi:hypothetical protein
LAGETGSEFPVFKTEGGAFDRAKFNESLSTSGGAIGVDSSVLDALKEANSVGDAAKKFFKGAFEQNLKALDPAYDPRSVFYREARSPSGLYQKSIQNKIDNGEAIDGKEIFEMSKKAAEKKIANVAILKTGKVTEILENVGFDDFKSFDAYEDVKSDFDSKIKEDKFKFDSVLDGFWLLLDDLNSKEPIPTQTLQYLNNPENSAILSAVAKVLESEGFNSESVLAMSKRYEESLAKLVEISEKGSVEGAKTPAEEKKIETSSTATTEEQKVGEKKEETKGGETGSTPVESAKTETTATTTGTTGTEAKGTTQENTLANKTGEEPKKLDGVSGTGGTENKSQPASAEVSSKIDNLISNLFGVKGGAGGTGAGAGGTGAGGTGAGTTGGAQSLENKLTTAASNTSQEVRSAIDKNLESLGFKAKSSPSGNSTSTVENLSPKNETSSTPKGIKETETQKLSSVAPPAENKPTEETTTSTTTPVNSETVTNKVSAETASVNSTTGNEQTKGETPKETVSSTGNEDLSKKMETMVTLLTQLNNTLQGPLLVTSTSKKID